MPTASSGPFNFAISGKHSPLFRKSVTREAEGHHPDFSFGWGYVTVSLSTKKIKGLHENDFIMASKIDRVLDRSGRSLDR
jgi:pterin-4a-carbinolamine dehydratase